MVRSANAASSEGFTVVELLVVVAIVGVLASLSAASYQRFSEFGAVQAAATELQSALGGARTRAAARNVDVWIVIYPRSDNAGSGAGPGAYVVLEDPEGEFQSTFAPFSSPQSLAAPSGGRVLKRVYLGSYAKGAPSFSPPPGAPAFPGPFAALSPSSRECSFCSGNGYTARGAIVFQPNGTARFVDGDGTDAPPGPGTLALTGAKGDRGYLFAIAPAVGFTRNWAVP